MYNYKIFIAYDGTKFNGFQKQVLHPEKTIQGKLENVLSLLFKEPVQVIGSGRTDAGVHAKEQVCNFHTSVPLPPEDILTYCAQYLPKDIAILNLTLASPRFHARYNSSRKKYCYTIDNQFFADPFMLKFAYHIPDELNVEKMSEASKRLIGTYDFKSFTSLKSKKKSTVRTLYDLSITKDNHLIKIYYEADGFLQHMVRIITGTLIEVGLGLRQPDDLTIILQNEARSTAGPTAPAHGLCMEKVYY
ncbi:tRNA pseudouridine(38-40) synthase TruA [Cellulosilyticum sp. I15G10I2]|uniref:tRNA pseudouridine(38-40) synthase TruA n=1 Tax=Cellulosilyticum sp. I15G10I2 TaxID=1892843 RepID=UPI00085CA92D|nr:tRNA pseudouridine(38-40) synthase TruA [Cellulosilyticum sp. I15G10I2]